MTSKSSINNIEPASSARSGVATNVSDETLEEKASDESLMTGSGIAVDNVDNPEKSVQLENNQNVDGNVETKDVKFKETFSTRFWELEQDDVVQSLQTVRQKIGENNLDAMLEDFNIMVEQWPVVSLSSFIVLWPVHPSVPLHSDPRSTRHFSD